MKCELAREKLLSAVKEKYGGRDIDPTLSLLLSGCCEFDEKLVLEIFPDADKEFLDDVKHICNCRECSI